MICPLNCRAKSLSLVVIILLGLLPVPLWAADIGSLSQNSDVILFGKAVSKQCQWAESSMNILTHTTFEIKKCVKGAYKTGDKITIETYGGSINGIKQNSPHAPNFSNGEQCLLFLNRGSKGVYLVYQNKDGKIPFVKKGEEPVTQEGKGLSNMIQEVKLSLDE